MRQKENRPGAGDAYGTVSTNCINDSTDMSEFQDLTYNGLLKACRGTIHIGQLNKKE